jgi:hypothetical protein
MKRPSTQNNKLEDMPLHIMAEKALREAVAEAIAEHKLRGHPIIVWRDGKVVSIPPEGIAVPAAKGISPNGRGIMRSSLKKNNNPSAEQRNGETGRKRIR